jgi:hypothetical protein
MKALPAILLFSMLGALPAAASDPLASLRYLVGTWNCTYRAGKVQVTYTATFAYDMSGNWMRERDSWAGGGGDQAMFTYEPKRRGWTAVIVEQERTAAIFRAAGANPNHLVYRSVYPDAGVSEIFDRTSPANYSLRFAQSVGGKTMKSTDACVKK